MQQVNPEDDRKRLSAYAHPSELVLSYVTHELGLQALGAQLAADMEGAFTIGDLFIPGAQIQHWLSEVHSRGPHQPPAVVSPFENSTIGAGTAVKGICDRVLEITKLHEVNRSCTSPLILAGNCEEVNRFDLRVAGRYL